MYFLSSKGIKNYSSTAKFSDLILDEAESIKAISRSALYQLSPICLLKMLSTIVKQANLVFNRYIEADFKPTSLLF